MVLGAGIGIICKAPQPGRTKTRLAAAIGAEAAAHLSACFLRDVATTIGELPAGLGYRAYAVYAPAGTEQSVRGLLPSSFELLLQADAELGKVLLGAMRDLMAAGHDCVVLVNGDSPTLPGSLVCAAIDALRAPGDRLVLGPASDGGYYLIGLKAPHARVFAGIPWGTDRVASLTLERASEIALPAVCLPEWYDIDDAESLGWLREELSGQSQRFGGGGNARATRAFLADMTVAAQ